MTGIKRRRTDSAAGTPPFHPNNRRGTSSSAQSTPTHEAHHVEQFHQRVKKRVSLLPPSNQPSSRILSTPPQFPHWQSHPQSASPSQVEIRPEDDTVIQEREDTDSLNEVIMCVDMRDQGTVGCCYYVARDQRMYVMADVAYGGVEVIETLKLYIQPTVVILSTRVDEVVETCFDPEGDQFALPYIIESRPSPEFSYEGGKNKLINLNLSTHSSPETSFVTPGYDEAYEAYQDGNEAGFTGRQGRLLRLATWIDMESRLMVGCAGALITYVGRRKAVEYLPTDPAAAGSFRILAVEMFSLQGMMFVNADTLASLQILQSEFGPNTHSQGPTRMASGSKEGLSVYGLFHHLARTPQGKYLLRQYFLRPSLDPAVINERLETVSTFLRPDNSNSMNSIVKSLRQIKNMKTVMIHLRKGISSGLSKWGGIKSGVWSSLRSFAFYTLQIRDAVMQVAHVERLTVGAKVDFTSSAEMYRTVINAGVDLELDEMKRSYDGLDDLLGHTARQVAATVPSVYNLDLNVIFFPQIGFLISIPFNPTTGRGDYEGGEAEDQRWSRVFSTLERVYYKDARMLALDDHCGDIYGTICEREIEIVHDLGQQVLAHEEMLNAVSDVCGELDCLLAIAQGAKMYKFCRPLITESNVIDIKAGRHPLQELTVSSYVPNDAFLVGGSGGDMSCKERGRSEDIYVEGVNRHSGSEGTEGPSMLMMTGPNYSGKSVYLKQIALIVYMAHVGCFVPADQATIGLTDKILTRVATRETVSHFQSAFMIDLQQVALAISVATPRSLVMIDEFGKGTDSSDGAGLACGVFEYLLGLGEDRPKVLAATHFHEIFENGFLPPRSSLVFGYMEVRLDEEATELEDQITYLYNYRAGRSTMSYGSCCAALNGVDRSIVDRANELVELSAVGEDLVAACAMISREEEEDLKEAEDMAREFLARDIRTITSQFIEAESPQDPRGLLGGLIDTAEAAQVS